MLLIDALEVLSNNELSTNSEESFKVIANYMANKRGNEFKLTERERSDLYTKYRDNLEHLYIYAKDSMT